MVRAASWVLRERRCAGVRPDGLGEMKFLTFLTDLPDNVLGRALRDGYKAGGVAFSFSRVPNLLSLPLPLYTYQIYGRVMTSQNQATLWMLTIVTLFVFAVSSVIDDFRPPILINYGAA